MPVRQFLNMGETHWRRYRAESISEPLESEMEDGRKNWSKKEGEKRGWRPIMREVAGYRGDLILWKSIESNI